MFVRRGHFGHKLVSLALAMLMLCSQVVAASEVSAHGLCEHSDSSLLVEPVHQHRYAVDDAPQYQGASDQGIHDHICHVHPPAHGAPAGLPSNTADYQLAQAFLPFVAAWTGLAIAPPVPPPDA